MTKKLMLDNDVLNFIQNGNLDRDLVLAADAEYYVSNYQFNEFTYGYETLDSELKEEIDQVREDVDPTKTRVETVGFGESFGRAFGGKTGEVYEKLNEAGNADRGDLVGAEAAIVRGMTFVTNDKALQNILRSKWEEHLMTYEEFCEFVESDRR